MHAKIIHPREVKPILSQKININAALFIKAAIWNQSVYPSTGQLLNYGISKPQQADKKNKVCPNWWGTVKIVIIYR